MPSYFRHVPMAAAFVLIALIAFLYWSYKPRWLNEPYLHYAAEQWRTMRSGNLLERESRRVAGAAALDCGRVPHNGSATKVNNCVTSAWTEKRPFKARWELLGIDAVVEDGLLGTADGRLFQFQYLEGPYVPNWRSVGFWECSKPVTLRVDPDTGTLYCDYEATLDSLSKVTLPTGLSLPEAD